MTTPSPLDPARARPGGIGRARGMRLAAWFAVLVCVLALPRLAVAADTLAAWRSEATRIRLLAENDVPRALDEAMRLEAALPAAAPATDRARMLNLRARIELYLGQTERARTHARLAHDLAKQHQDRAGQVEADLNLALITVNLGDIEGLIAATTESLELLDGLDRPELLGEALLRTAMMYRRIGQIDESVTLSMKAMDIAERSTNPLVLTYAHQGMAISFDQSDRRAEARDHYLQMRRFAQAAGARLLEADALTSLGNLVAALGEPETGEAHIREAIDLYREIGTPFNLNHGLYALAGQLAARGDFARAQALLDEAVARLEQYPNPIGLWYVLLKRSANLQASGRTDAARADAERAYALARRIRLSPYIGQSAHRMAELAAAAGDHKRAYALAVEAAAEQAKADREASGERMIQLAKRYESEAERRQIEELTRRTELQTAELERRALQQGWLWTVLLGTLLALLGGGWSIHRLRQSHRLLQAANAQLQQSQDDIRSLNTALEQRVSARTAELRQRTHYLRTLIDTLPWWVWLKDTESRYLAVNQAAAATCHLSTEELVGKCDFDVRPPELAEAYRADDARVMNERRSITTEELQMVPGGTIWVETFKAPVLDDDGTVLGTVGFARDISERKEAENAREAALAEAQRLARLRSEFLAQMSHELRTPLNGILGYTQILLLDKSLDERQRAGMNVIRQSGEHLLTLINDVLELAKIEAGKLELCPAEVRLDAFLGTIAKLIRPKAEAKGLAFVYDPAPDLPVCVRADEKRLRQVLLNLLANAVKFTESGRLCLRVRCVAPSLLRFEVEDTGAGIDPGKWASIFQPFEQVGELPQRAAGAGLGLAISQQFVRLMGGEIRLESRVGEGSTFWFELDLPVLEPAAPPVESERAIVGYAGERRRLLVIDDIPENRAVLMDMLAPLGFEMEEAADAEAGLDKAQAEPPHLILMDAVMPGVDGLEATRRLRSMPALCHIPVLGISASASGSDEVKCRSAGMDAFLPKPVSRDALLAQIAALIHVEWNYDVPAPAPHGDLGPAESVVAPPRSELEALHRLALEGNMRDIIRQAARVSALDLRFGPFAEQLRQLAEDYQSQALLRLVERYLDRSPPHEHGVGAEG